ncbi:hypothetical protein HK099_007444 [Clydaea vesicula]|uniref:3-methyl-2-oxobutanoate hydroxymethyltransferase n=1 Tax=Clydaea vesicula TaxID=447962 RepID=A0AAD5U5G6_9FUNG|nr:hypothetical protein HK099_007444 [Clydaea vesicula]
MTDSLLHFLQLIQRNSSRPTEPAENSNRKKVTVQSLQRLYKKNVPITVMTAYDYPSGLMCDKTGMDICLVGDSLAMTALGYESTNDISFDEMLHHSRAVARGCKNSFIVGDLPFGTYETSANQALDSSIRFLREGKVGAVKFEGGKEVFEQVCKIVSAGIPVMAHIGLTPQRASALGGYKVQGKTVEKAKKLLEDALALQEAGAFSLVLEAIPTPVATFITKRLTIPTIGIGAGPHCSGQVLVYLDMLGMFDRFMPKFCKVYGEVGSITENALLEFKKEVIAKSFPDEKLHCYSMESAEEAERFKDWVAQVESSDNVNI